MNLDNPRVAIVIPCYNEEEVISKTHQVVQDKLLKMIDGGMIDKTSYMCFIDDGSLDRTVEILESLSKNSEISTKIVKLSRNFGHQYALLAGYHHVTNQCDCVISIDCDLQDDIEVFDQFIEEFKNGNEVIFGVRRSRKKDTLFKKITAEMFYKIMKFMCQDVNSLRGGGIIENHADYRLLSNRALNELQPYKESNLFIRGIVPLLGFKQAKVFYDRAERYAGVSKYPLKKMISFAWSGITSFSTYPLKLVLLTGIFCLFFAFILSIYVLYIVFFTPNATPGWASITIPISFFGGIQIFSIGILGEYIGKIYHEVKSRPRYIIEEVVCKREK